MLICRVIGHVWATKKQEALNGQKLMIVKETETAQGKGDVFVAADMVGAGVGEDVLVVTGRRSGGQCDRRYYRFYGNHERKQEQEVNPWTY